MAQYKADGLVAYETGHKEVLHVCKQQRFMTIDLRSFNLKAPSRKSSGHFLCQQ